MEKSLNRIIVVQKAIHKIKARTYLEIGVHSGGCFLSIDAPRKIAVDPFFQIPKGAKRKSVFKNSNNLFNRYYEMTSDDFFASQKKILEKGVDVVLIDGLHTYEQTLKDVENSLKYLNKNGVIVMHDCKPASATIGYPANSLEDAAQANLIGWTGEWCGDVWKVIVNLRSLRKDTTAFVLDCDQGLGIIIKENSENDLNYTLNDIQNLSFSDLEKNPEHFIGLKNENYYESFINDLKLI